MFNEKTNKQTKQNKTKQNKTKQKQNKQQQQQRFWPVLYGHSELMGLSPNFRGHANIMTSYEDGWYLF